jgi:hypothetical protein
LHKFLYWLIFSNFVFHCHILGLKFCYTLSFQKYSVAFCHCHWCQLIRISSWYSLCKARASKNICSHDPFVCLGCTQPAQLFRACIDAHTHTHTHAHTHTHTHTHTRFYGQPTFVFPKGPVVPWDQNCVESKQLNGGESDSKLGHEMQGTAVLYTCWWYAIFYCKTRFDITVEVGLFGYFSKTSLEFTAAFTVFILLYIFAARFM